ncbi:Rho GTPase activation protein [Chytriomyces cf. hyalinus JEL632]|nr:Rho GTPase activation protein [Chytriomyces cf. hyalinus JEL632]
MLIIAQSYANLVSLLRSEPMHLASLAHAVSLNEMNACAESTIFSIYGNQFNRREECLLLSLLQRIMSIQFDKANNFGSVMRANTPASRMLSSYTRRRAGAQYLRHTVAMLMTHLVDLGDTVLEINPLKLDSNHPAATRKSFSSSHRPDYYGPAHSESFCKSPIRNVFSSLPRKSSMPAAFKLLDQVVDDRVQLLAQLVDRFLDTLMESIENVPYEIRWLCKQIWMIAKAKFPHESESNIASLVGGFFLLRYINPAIVSPESILKPSELDPIILSPNGRRTLTLVAKALQMIANKPSAVKETYMAPLIPLIQQQKIRIAHFFHQLCNVEDFQTLATTTKDEEDECSEDCFAVFKDSDAIDLQIRVDELQRLCGLLEQHLDRLDPTSAKCIQPILESISNHNPSQLSTPLQRSIVTLELSPPTPSSASNSSSDLNNANPSDGSTKHLFRHLLLALLRNQSDSDLFSPIMTDTNTSSFTILSILLNHAIETYPKDSHLFTLGEKARVALQKGQQQQQQQEPESVESDTDSIVESLCFDMEQLTQRCCRLLEEIDELETVLYTLLQAEKELHEKVCERDRRMHRLSSSSRIKSIWSYIVGK